MLIPSSPPAPFSSIPPNGKLSGPKYPASPISRSISALAIVTMMGISTFLFSIVALNAFFNSSVIMYSRWLGTYANSASVMPSTTTVGRTPYRRSQMSPTNSAQYLTMVVGLRCVSIVPIYVDSGFDTPGRGRPCESEAS
ncbi:hypothetical protein ABW19_dt0210486 [Dactylella cylindrospora]|nr:hypothetical protein ABW19_dt0210486 [Dactylella cylindrospora]